MRRKQSGAPFVPIRREYFFRLEAVLVLLGRCRRFCFLLISLLCAAWFLPAVVCGQDAEIPDSLKPWTEWVTWDVKHLDCPTLYTSADQPVCFWPSTLELSAEDTGAKWSMSVQVFGESWVPLPGTRNLWPTGVRDGEENLVVLERQGRPVVRLTAGDHELTGQFLWSEMPQKLSIPNEIGILSLRVSDEEVPIPNWDANGEVWLRRIQSQPEDKDRLSAQVYRAIEDGIPLWMRTEIELTVSGSSREEELGWILPEGWLISTLESPIPVAIDDRGRIRAQVRAGKWSVMLHAFRTTDPGEIRYPAEAEPVAVTELVGLKLDPSFRISQIEGLPSVDVTQTTFPLQWRGLPVYQWDTDEGFQLVEKQRGMGDESPEGLTIDRRFWLDEDGEGLTYVDQLRGKMQRIWRLDVAEGNNLGAVRIDGESQLITANPQTSASGVEIRSRNLPMEAIGRAPVSPEIQATGWQTDAESLRLTLTLPPGWRVFAMFGADRVEGDWLTAWSLLDLFLLLIFSLAVYRMHGFAAGIIALLAFGLAYHEVGAPRWTWFVLLVPLALLRVVGEGTGRKLLQIGKALAIAILLFALVPFVARQLQAVIYPQLESAGFRYGSRSVFDISGPGYARYGGLSASSLSSSSEAASAAKQAGRDQDVASNLLFDPASRIQTGPAQPAWEWNDVLCIWNGPVTAEDRIRPIFISLAQHRVLSVVRVALLILLAVILIRGGKLSLPRIRPKAAVAAAFVLALFPESLSAQFPDQELLDSLRQRLLQTPDVFPNAAEIPAVELSLDGNQVEIRSQIHAAIDVAVPLPGKIPEWSPLTVTIDGKPDVLVTRRDGYVWVLVPKGAHEVVASGLLGDRGNWEWTFLLKPKYVTIDAAGWRISGVNEDGVPDSQVFFTKEQPASNDQVAYDRTDFNPIVVVDRYMEIGLLWRLRSTVTRLSEPGKAISLEVPLLENEGVLTSNRDVSEGTIAVRLGAMEKQFEWESQLPSGSEIQLTAAQTDRWVERWHLVASPVWNVAIAGLQPIYQTDQAQLIPLWQPWPEESVNLSFNRLVAVSGDVLTVQTVEHEFTLGSRRRSSRLSVDMECSLASDFVIELGSEAEVVTLTVDSDAVPPQRDGAQLIVPVSPGKHKIAVTWNTSQRMRTTVTTDTVKLPVDGANITTAMIMPENRWILWADGPLRGPAVRFWTILLVALLAALALGSVPKSPLRRWEWVLLVIGLTQVHLVAATIVVLWLFALAYRGDSEITNNALFNLMQFTLVMLTVGSLAVLMFVVGAGLLGHPDMFIVGNGSSRLYLRWFEPRSGPGLPTPLVVSVSVWFYRLLMLFWALWLAASLLKWLTRGWQQFTSGGAWRRRRRLASSE